MQMKRGVKDHFHQENKKKAKPCELWYILDALGLGMKLNFGKLTNSGMCGNSGQLKL